MDGALCFCFSSGFEAVFPDDSANFPISSGFWALFSG